MFLWWLDTLLRFLQFAFCLIALITLSSGFVVASYYGYTSMLGSSPATYAQLMTFLGMLYALWFLLFMNATGMFARPYWLFEAGMDVLLTILLLVAAIVLLVSDYVQHCGVYGIMLRCRSLNTAVVFTFLSMAAFLGSALLSLFGGRREEATRSGGGGVEEGEGGLYHSETTPTAQGSPKSPSGRI